MLAIYPKNIIRIAVSIVMVSILSLGISVLQAQSDDPQLIIFRDEDSLTIFAANASDVQLLKGLQISAVVSGQTVPLEIDRYFADALGFIDAIAAPVCLRLERDRSERAVPNLCPPGNIFITTVPSSEVIWYDTVLNRPLTLLIQNDLIPQVLCANSQSSCQIVLVPPTSTPRPTLTPTITLTPSITPTPNVTETRIAATRQAAIAQANATATEAARPRVVVASNTINLRSGPHTSYDVVGSANRGESLYVIGRTGCINPEYIWYQVLSLSGERAWVFSNTVELSPSGFDFTNLPVVSPEREVGDPIALIGASFRHSGDLPLWSRPSLFSSPQTVNLNRELFTIVDITPSVQNPEWFNICLPDGLISWTYAALIQFN